ncbi:MAG: hypothetical protein EXS27_11160 [Pedosphaera sp.]|nr:hypothetical protein [Pedosphaera sp.]
MSVKTAGYLILYGAFLIVCGALGYGSNPEKAKTALMSGGTFGALSILWGVLGARGLGWSLVAAQVTTGLLTLVFAWRASDGWKAVVAGNSDKLFAASLITAMLVGSVVMLVLLQIGRETPGDKPPSDPPA